MDDTEKRGEEGRRVKSADRRQDTVTAKNWPRDKERRSGKERRAEDRRKRCVHCGKTYKYRTGGQPECGCRLKALHNPGA